MAAPFDKKFRQKVVDTYINGNLSYADVGELFGIGEATVNRWVSRFRKKGKVDASPMGGARGKPLIDEAGIAYLKELLAANPTFTQAELAAAFERKFGVEVSRRLISSTLKRIKYTKKRGRRRSPASKRADVVERREEWLAIMPDLDVERLAFLDETGFQHSMVDDFGWAPAGETPLILAPYRGRNVTLIGVIRADGPVASVVQDGYMSKAQFLSALLRCTTRGMRCCTLVGTAGPAARCWVQGGIGSGERSRRRQNLEGSRPRREEASLARCVSAMSSGSRPGGRSQM